MVLFITSVVIVYKVCISSWSYLLHQWWLRTRFVWAHGPIYYINGDCVQVLYKLMVLFITSMVIVYKVCMSSWSYLLHQWWLCTRFVWAHGPIYYISGDCVQGLYELMVLFIISVVTAYKVCTSSWSYLLHQWWLRTRFVRALGPIYYISGDCVQGLYELLVLFITSVVTAYKVCMSSWSYLLHQWWLCTRFVRALGPIYYISGDCVQGLYELMVLFITSIVIVYKVCTSSWSYLLHQWWLCTRFLRAHGPIYYISGDCVQGLYELMALFITSMVIVYKVCTSSWSYLLHQWWLRTRFVRAHGPIYYISGDCVQGLYELLVLFITSVVTAYKVCTSSWSYLLHQWWLCTRFVRAHGPIYYISGDCVQGLYELLVLFITSIVIVYKVCTSSWSYLLHQWWLRTRFVRAHGPIYYISGDCVQGLYELMVLFITSVVIVYKVCTSSWSYLLHLWWLCTRFVRAHGPIYYISGDCIQGLYKLRVLFITSVVTAYKVCTSSWSYLLHQWWLRTRFVRAHGPIYYINGDCVQGLYELMVLFITSVVIVYKVCTSSWSYLLHQCWLCTRFV